MTTFMHDTCVSPCAQLNIFLAILVDAYAKVKEEAQDSGNGLAH